VANVAVGAVLAVTEAVKTEFALPSAETKKELINHSEKREPLSGRIQCLKLKL
jgi:hypothetical protein